MHTPAQIRQIARTILATPGAAAHVRSSIDDAIAWADVDHPDDAQLPDLEHAIADEQIRARKRLRTLELGGSRCSARVDGREHSPRLVVTLTRDAARRWGAYLPEGVDSPAAYRTRQDIQRAIRDAMAALGVDTAEIYARHGSASGAWLLTEIND